MWMFGKTAGQPGHMSAVPRNPLCPEGWKVCSQSEISHENTGRFYSASRTRRVLTLSCLPVWERLQVAVSQHSGLLTLHEPPSSHCFPRSPPACVSGGRPTLWRTQKTKKGRGFLWWREHSFYFWGNILKSLLLWMRVVDRGKHCLSFFPISALVSTSPLAFNCLVGLFISVDSFIFCIWTYIYCLDCCWTSLWYQNERKWTKKTPSVLKYCIAIVFNAKYYL